MTENQSVSLLLFKNLQGTITEEEKVKLNIWVSASSDNHSLFEELMNEDKLPAAISEYHPEKRQALENRILERIKDHVPALKVIPMRRRSFFRVAVAASIILAITLGGYFVFFNKENKKPPIAKVESKQDVKAPVITKATITLADGRKVSIDSLISLQQGNVNIKKNENGEIVYNGANDKVEYNTLVNPRGSKVQSLTLVDGTKVWMNAESSLKYFTSVGKTDRRVEITGECYFEAAHDATRPFIVKDVSRNTEVQVLGTHFNVNTYSDEPTMKITLLEGSVKVSKGNLSQLLKPGQQAQVENEIKVVNDVDLDQVMAWKNGLFTFNRADIQTVMRELGRWYDVEVEYKGPLPVMEFGGELERSLSLSQVLNALDKSKVHFSIEGKKIVVTR